MIWKEVFPVSCSFYDSTEISFSTIFFKTMELCLDRWWVLEKNVTGQPILYTTVVKAISDTSDTSYSQVSNSNGWDLSIATKNVF